MMKKAGDELERLRILVDRALNWFAAGSDPSRLLSLCIRDLRKYPFARNLLQSSHVARLLSRLYLADRLTGRYLPEIQSFRCALPPADSPFLVATHQSIDGLIAVLAGDSRTGGHLLKTAAQWYQEHGLSCDAAVGWLGYAWAIIDIDAESAKRSAMVAYEYMSGTGFAGHDQQILARQILLETQGHALQRDTLRKGILLLAAPKNTARLAPLTNRVSTSTSSTKI
jgi:hypothetical protein